MSVKEKTRSRLVNKQKSGFSHLLKGAARNYDN